MVRSVLKGVVHGKTLVLAQAPDLPEGQEVTVTLQWVESNQARLPPGEGLRRSFGGWTEDAHELHRYLAWNRQQRKFSRPDNEP